MATEKKAPAKKAVKKKAVAKKAAAKKPVAKKAPAKKAAANIAPEKKDAVKKKVTAKKAPVKKAAAKKPVAKKAPAKKAAIKKSPVKKTAVKKAPVKKSAVKKAPVKKVPAKKASVKTSPVNKASFKEAVATAIEAEVKPSSVSVLEPVAQTTTLVREELQASKPVEQAKPSETEKKRRLGFLLLVAAVALFGFALISNSGTSSEVKEVVKEEVLEKPTESPAPVVLEAPVDVFADYTPTGGIVTWSAPSNSEGLNSYLVQSSFAGGEYVTIATLEITVSSFEVMKVDTPSSTRFRVVAIYESGEAVSEPSEIKGQYEPQS